jgi:hypothetical protein
MFDDIVEAGQETGSPVLSGYHARRCIVSDYVLLVTRDTKPFSKDPKERFKSFKGDQQRVMRVRAQWRDREAGKGARRA